MDNIWTEKTEKKIRDVRFLNRCQSQRMKLGDIFSVEEVWILLKMVLEPEIKEHHFRIHGDQTKTTRLSSAGSFMIIQCHHSSHQVESFRHQTKSIYVETPQQHTPCVIDQFYRDHFLADASQPFPSHNQSFR